MRNWKPYSSVARDGEKTVYCQKGNHSVYYGNAFISFKPSKLVWCEECKDTYYEVKPTLFDELITKEVIKMDTTKVNSTTNPKEGLTMKYQMFYEPGWDPILCPMHLHREYKMNDAGITMQQWAGIRNVLPIKTDLPCEFCIQDENGCNQEVTKMDTTKVNPITNPKEGPTMKVEETTFTMTDKQIAFIRDLFKSKKQFMTIDEQESLVNKMKGHLDGSAVLTTKWASAAIAKLKSYNKERSAS